VGDIHSRKAIRLKKYDYSLAGYYFITMCTRDRKNLFADIPLEACRGGCPHPPIVLTSIGQVVDEHIRNIDFVYPNVNLDCYSVMPNHLHLLISLDDDPENHQDLSIPEIIKSLKTLTTKKAGLPLWQRSYYEHIVRNEKDLKEIREYISNNPVKWAVDKYYVKHD
jgi:putative transposase